MVWSAEGAHEPPVLADIVRIILVVLRCRKAKIMISLEKISHGFILRNSMHFSEYGIGSPFYPRMNASETPVIGSAYGPLFWEDLFEYTLTDFPGETVLAEGPDPQAWGKYRKDCIHA